MKIRWKLLILLLAIALVSLGTGAVLQRISMRRLGNHLAATTREILTDSASRHLRRIVDDYGRILDRDRAMLELALTVQQREVERRLASPPPPAARLFLAEDYDGGVNLPAGMAPSDKHYRPGPDGRPVPTPVTYDQQVCFVVSGVDRSAVIDDMKRLSTMPEAYRVLHRSQPEMIFRQYTGLESGLHTSYPGHGGFPPGYDPRGRQWYRAAKAAGTLTWTPPTVDASTRTVTLGLAMPVRRPDGSPAGVTGIDVPLKAIFGQVKLPEEWSGGLAMLVVVSRPGEKGQGKPVIVAQQSYQDQGRDWETPVALQVLESDDAGDLDRMLEEVRAHRSGVRRMRYRGRDAFWAHGAGGGDTPFPVVIVPYDQVVGKAADAQQYVLDRISDGLRVTGLILLGIVAGVVVVAIAASRSVTLPIRRLAEAARRLSGGDYEAAVRIRTGDELQELGDVFSDVGPKLRERERMKHSLALAMEIQQHLLPQGPPHLDGFDIAGQIDYCDETGGDYYDFIDLAALGERKLGIAVGDVTGHGIGAALLMASARAVLRSHAARHGSDLGELFGALNTHLVRDTGEAFFMTLFYGVLDAATRSLSWTSGGHDPPLWLHHGDARIEELPNTGVPLGILEDATYSQGGPVTLQPGDVIAIGTDGIWEAHNPAGEMFGKDRLRKVLAASAGGTAADIYAAVVDAVEHFRGTAPQDDDVTLVAIKTL